MEEPASKINVTIMKSLTRKEDANLALDRLKLMSLRHTVSQSSVIRAYMLTREHWNVSHVIHIRDMDLSLHQILI